MGAVDTTYTFTATDTITSTKMNNIIDQTTMTADAIIGNTLDVASGKLRVRAQGITSNEMGNNSVVTSAITDANVTQAKLAPNVAGNGPAFSAYASSSQSITPGTFTKVAINTEFFDTNSNFNTSLSRFTPNVAGYYQINGSVRMNFSNPTAVLVASIFKNGSEFNRGVEIVSSTLGSFLQMTVSSLIYLNGSTDYVELFGYCGTSGTATFSATALNETSSFSGFLARSA